MTLQMNRSGPVTVVAVQGEVDCDNAHIISELVDSLTGGASQRLVLDLAQVTFLSTAGVEAFLQVRDSVTAHAGELILRNPSAIVLTALAGSRVSRTFHVDASAQQGE